MGLMRNVLLPQGYFPGYTIETLKDVRFYEVGSEQDLQAKWPKLRAAQGDLIKFILFNSDEYDARKDNSAFFGGRGLDPKIAPLVVRMAHRDGLRAAAHVVNVADYRVALDAGVDIIAHLPMEGMLTEEDARRTAARGVSEAGARIVSGSDDPADTATRREQSFRSGRSALCKRVTKPASWRSKVTLSLIGQQPAGSSCMSNAGTR
jgi:imidazolonepropionase-like amidohydrolase